MRVYLVDGSNAVRRGNYDPRFPEMEELHTARFLRALSDLAEGFGGQILIEVFFDGPRRPMERVSPPVHIRFPFGTDADEAILGSARRLLSSGRGAVVVTADGALAAEARAEGARVIGFGELKERLRSGRA